MTRAVLEKNILITIRLAAKVVQQEVGLVIYPRNRQVSVEFALTVSAGIHTRR